jgi:peroxiredoxin Q/BCP
MPVQEGHPVTAFSRPDADEVEVSSDSLKGRWIVLYFYPKDDTSGCTAEACEFRDDIPRFDGMDAAVVGVSPDPPKSHRKFRDKYDLNFTLLADEDHSLAEAFGVWKEKSMYGRKYWGIERSTFLIDPAGVLRREWRKVKAKGHAEAVRSALEEMAKDS